MTEQNVKTARRYRVGKASVLRRYLSVPALMGTALAFVLAAVPVAALSDQREGPVEAAFVSCVPALENGHFPDRTDMTAMSETDLSFLKKQLGHSSVDHAWTNRDQSWFVLETTVQEGLMCEAFSLNAPLEPAVAAWNGMAQMQRDGFRFAKPAVIKLNQDGNRRASGFAARPVQDGFLQLGLIAIEAQDGLTYTGISTLRLGQTTASCKLWPEECI